MNYFLYCCIGEVVIHLRNDDDLLRLQNHQTELTAVENFSYRDVCFVRVGGGKGL